MKKIYSKSDLMKIAVEEHLKCTEFPRVGVVVARDGVILSTGYRGEVPGFHAERVALQKISKEERIGSEVFTTLEPCVYLHEEQPVESCSDLIVASGVVEVVIGVLDPNGAIYSQGYRKLLDNNISVSFFTRRLRAAVEEETFEYGQIDRVYGSGKRRVPVLHSGLKISVQFNKSDSRTIQISWETLQFSHGVVDLHGPSGSVVVASGARKFSDITDPEVFRFSSHVARLSKGQIAIVQPAGATFCVLVKVLDLFKSDIIFQWEVRNIK